MKMGCSCSNPFSCYCVQCTKTTPPYSQSGPKDLFMVSLVLVQSTESIVTPVYHIVSIPRSHTCLWPDPWKYFSLHLSIYSLVFPFFSPLLPACIASVLSFLILSICQNHYSTPSSAFSTTLTLLPHLSFTPSSPTQSNHLTQHTVLKYPTSSTFTLLPAASSIAHALHLHNIAESSIPLNTPIFTLTDNVLSFHTFFSAPSTLTFFFSYNYLDSFIRKYWC